MQITVNTESLSDLDRQVLAVLAGGTVTPVAAPDAPAPKAEKAAPKASKKAEPEPDTAEGDTEPTMDDAVKLATKLVSSGQAAKVKAALAEHGAKRVSELKDDKIAAFVASLS